MVFIKSSIRTYLEIKNLKLTSLMLVTDVCEKIFSSTNSRFCHQHPKNCHQHQCCPKIFWRYLKIEAIRQFICKLNTCLHSSGFRFWPFLGFDPFWVFAHFVFGPVLSLGPSWVRDHLGFGFRIRFGSGTSGHQAVLDCSIGGNFGKSSIFPVIQGWFNASSAVSRFSGSHWRSRFRKSKSRSCSGEFNCNVFVILFRYGRRWNPFSVT